MTISMIFFYIGLWSFIGLGIFLRFVAPMTHFSWQASVAQWLAFIGVVFLLSALFTWIIL